MKRPSATAFLFVTVLVDMLGYGLVVPLLLAVLLLNLAFAGLLTNFPIFSGARFGWGASETSSSSPSWALAPS